MKHFFDVGANIGQTFDDFLLRGDGFDGATIWCFEPSPRHLSQLRTRLSALAADTVHNWFIHLCPFGLSDGGGLLRLHEKIDPRGDSFHENLFLQGYSVPNMESDGVEVICDTRDAGMMVETCIHADDLVTIKIDTEGSEFGIIRSILNRPAIWKRIECLMVEWHGIDSPNGKEEEQIKLQEDLQAAQIRLEGWQY